MAGFSGSTGVPKKYVDDSIQQSTAVETITFGTAASNVSEKNGYKYGKTAQIRIAFSSLQAGWNNDINIGLPTGSRPVMNVAGARQITVSANANTPAFSTLAGSGLVNVYAEAAITSQVVFTYTYVVGN